ncbi:hypothetical protein OC846_000412 [Tilletia horrida]|uniref:Uncharacterized protein n=1 Tax=Tilletia horrida TaxID=155126 RepID=A0AAN6GVU3_9BASI|nr:hypothetical protein OC846_000412 [Tilletia horrida]KAK0569528.1 hypothetical protein OC861_000797 [Tilletia horrida]
MFMRRSTHKRKRSSTRADHARDEKALGGGRSILDIGFFKPVRSKGKEKAKEPDEQMNAASMEADHRCLRAVEKYAFTHSLDVILPLRNIDPESAERPEQALLSEACSQDDALKGLMQSFGIIDSTGSVPSSKVAASHSKIYLAKVPLALFLNPEFVTGFIRNGTLIALSTGTSEADDIVALDPQGILTLSLTRETYQTLGLVGRESRFRRGPSGRAGDRNSGPAQRYIVQLPITAPSFVPGKPGYERALACLRAWDWSRASQANDDPADSDFTKLSSISIGGPVEPGGRTGSKDANATWNMLFAWAAPTFAEASIHTGTIVFPKSLVDAGDARQIPAPGIAVITPDTWIPTLVRQPENLPDTKSQHAGLAHHTEATLVETIQASSKNGAMDEVYEAVEGLTEWIALVTLGSESVRTFARPDPLVNSYEIPSPRQAGTTLRLTWTGFFPPSFTTAVIKQVVHFLDASSPGSGERWAAISVEGFEHSPISWLSTHPGQGAALGSGATLPTAKTKISTGSKPAPKQSRSEPASSTDVQMSMPASDQASASGPENDPSSSDSSDSDSETAAPTSNGQQVSKKNAKQRERLKRRRKGHTRQGESEHGGGRTGWTAWFLSRASTQSSTAADSERVPRYIMLEDLGADLRQ